jgi:hypothetical protein
MPFQSWESLLNSPILIANGTTLSNSTTASDLTAAPQLTLPANYLYTGQVLRVSAFGTVTTGASAGNITLGVSVGGWNTVANQIASTGAVALTSSVGPFAWTLTSYLTVRSVGATGTMMSGGEVHYWTSATASVLWSLANQSTGSQTLGTAQAINTTQTNTITIGATFSAAVAANSITCYQAFIEAMD